MTAAYPFITIWYAAVFAVLPEQMLDQYLCSDQNQDNAACDFCIFSELSADAVAEKDGSKTEYAGGGPDQTDGGKDVYLQEGEADAYGERVNARCDGEEQDFFVRNRFNALRTDFFLLTGFADHIDSDNAKQDEGDPVIDGGDRIFKMRPCQPADQGHEALKKSEGERETDCVTFDLLFQADTFGE